ncbi:PREDICTED: hsp70-binding protein 1 [Sturnus vulgaris]|uniref:hsp70-binding protein 1 n=1 Tax=Sturnus vulgaris TaxID=9172 RepID=UPI00071A4C86|nr:PREDICTED: hsp70-binding protein 1 [Sturnus vulgaris]
MAVVAGQAQPEPREPMGEERQQWLRAAVSEALGNTGGDHGELQRCLAVLAQPCPGEEAAERGPGDTEAHEQALDELAELCESLDRPLLRLGFVPRLVALLSSEHDGAHEHGLGALCRWVTPKKL